MKKSKKQHIYPVSALNTLVVGYGVYHFTPSPVCPSGQRLSSSVFCPSDTNMTPVTRFITGSYQLIYHLCKENLIVSLSELFTYCHWET